MEKEIAYLGVDVSKGYSDFIMLHQNKEVLEKGFQLDDNHDGHFQLTDRLKTLIKENNLREIQCAVESTGGYENNWYNLLKELGSQLPLKVARLNPRGVKANRDASLSKNVTDELAAKYVAEYLISHPDKVEFNKERIKNYDSLRKQYGYIKLLTKQATQISNQLEKILYDSFPEIVSYCKNGIPMWVLRLLKKYPTADKLGKATVNGVSKIKGISVSSSDKLIKKAGKTVSRHNDPYIASLIISQAKELLRLRQLIEMQKDMFNENAGGEDIELLESIPGFGRYSATALMIEIEDIEKFATCKNLISYSGIHPEMKESGDKKRKVRMSKKGRVGIRAILYNVARTAARDDPHIKDIYTRFRKRGYSYYAAIGVIMNKMLRIAYGVLKSKKAYDSDIDKGNQKKSSKEKPSAEEREIKHIEVSRRYQKLGSDAPISGRKMKKRRALIESQSNDITENGIIKTAPVAKL